MRVQLSSSHQEQKILNRGKFSCDGNMWNYTGTEEESGQEKGVGGVKLFIGYCVNRNVSISHSSQHVQSMKNHTNHTSEKLVETL